MTIITNWYTSQQMPVISTPKPGAAFRLTVARALAELRYQRRANPDLQARINKIQSWAERHKCV